MDLCAKTANRGLVVERWNHLVRRQAAANRRASVVWTRGLFGDETQGWGVASADGAGLASTFGLEATPQGVVVADDRIVIVGTLKDGWADPAVWVAHLPDRSSGG